jgi:hypothetical protein
MHAPFVLAAIERARAINHDLALPQCQQAAIEQAAGIEALINATVDRQSTEQHERIETRRHDSVERRLNVGRIRRI